MIYRVSLASGLTAAASATAVTAPPSYGVPEIVLFGVTVSTGPALVAAGGALLLRLIIGSTDGWKKGDLFLTVFLMVMSAVIASDAKQGAGLSLIMGGSIGAGGMGVVKWLKTKGVIFLDRFFKAWKAAGDAKPEEDKPEDPPEVETKPQSE